MFFSATLLQILLFVTKESFFRELGGLSLELLFRSKKGRMAWLIVIFPLLIYFFLFTVADRPTKNIPILKGGVLPKISDDLGLNQKTAEQDSQLCTFIRKGCEEYLNIIPGTPEYLELDQERQRCANSGCVVWGASVTSAANLSLTQQQLTALINDLKPWYLPFKNIRIKIDPDKIYMEGYSFLPPVVGLLTLILEPSGTKQIKVVEGYLGRIPLSSSILYFIENRINGLLIYNWYGSTLDSFQLSDGQVYLEARLAPQLISIIRKSR